MKISAIIKAVRARISYVPNRTNYLTSFMSKGGSPLTGEDIICAYIDALNALKERSPYVRRYCFLRAMGFEKAEIELINVKNSSLNEFIKNLNVDDMDLSIKYKEKWSKQKNIKKVLRKVVSKQVVVYSGTNNLDKKEYKKLFDNYDDDIKKMCGVFRKKYSALDWELYRQEALTKLIELMQDSLSDLKKLSNRGYVMTTIKNHLVDVINSEEKHKKRSISLDKLFEEFFMNEDKED